MPHRSRRQSPQVDCERIAARLRDALASLREGCDGALAVIAEARQLLQTIGAHHPDVISFPGQVTRYSNGDVPAAAEPATLPCWDKALGVLSVGGRPVKRFRVPAPNQAAVLSAFEEEGWPPRIDDPLPPEANVDPKYRLRFTIGRLNHAQQSQGIHFFGDGTGEGVCWALSEAAESLMPGTAALHEQRRAA